MKNSKQPDVVINRPIDEQMMEYAAGGTDVVKLRGVREDICYRAFPSSKTTTEYANCPFEEDEDEY